AQSYEQLTNIDKLSDRTATLFKLIHNATLVAYRHDLSAVPVFHNQTQLLDYLRVMLGSAKHEECHILYLDDACRLIIDDMHSAGTNNWAAVYPREILKRAMAINAKQIIMVHNHPSYAEPFSGDDVAITQEVIDLLKPVGIILNDHYLVCADKVFSMRNSQLIR
ncbi:hypothetical protein HDR66_02465, partial [bacterium]|nr:hypothetical protein [bacterium]